MHTVYASAVAIHIFRHFSFLLSDVWAYLSALLCEFLFSLFCLNQIFIVNLSLSHYSFQFGLILFGTHTPIRLGFSPILTGFYVLRLTCVIFYSV